MEVRSRRQRETSPDRAKVCMRPTVKPIKKVQVVYYLSRNGHLEHPHYMEVTHLPNQPLRLRDVMDRLTTLRGKGMPALYSWSCKRSYKNGYVWNDLAENDVIYPAEGLEYVLKGSELVEGCSERLQQLQLGNRQQVQDHLNFQSRQKALAPSRQRENEEAAENTKYEDQADYDEEEEEYEDEEKTSYTSSTTPHSRCSRGVSTDELEEDNAPTQKNPSESTLSGMHSSSIMVCNKSKQSNNVSKRFEDGDPVEISESAPSRNSVLLQLIACGSSAVAKATKNSACVKQPVYNGSSSSSNNCRAVKRSSSESFHRGVVCRRAMKVAEEEEMINYMSENPRFGNLQAEEKEYFSGSILESMKEDRVAEQPVLKKSNSYNEERSTKARLGEETVEEEEKKEKAALRGKCMPRKKFSGSSKQPKK
ncbi:hypothetical protein FEM48_Zijuj08G0165400 [Ziziphus jujuba var. spinosa]|uniref:protein UPSTREAM OF FLC n=2 Tax=Ziziphus jujuba TaxID=326968 RepID=A0A6P4APN0_ZIZJJ|nr:hypothetical protein FEM48_Zijuj08G0165400 [Ziziphus jujuba var. spinosa]